MVVLKSPLIMVLSQNSLKVLQNLNSQTAEIKILQNIEVKKKVLELNSFTTI